MLREELQEVSEVQRRHFLCKLLKRAGPSSLATERGAARAINLWDTRGIQ